MKRHLLTGLALLALFAVGARPAQAQEGFYFGVGGGGTEKAALSGERSSRR